MHFCVGQLNMIPFIRLPCGPRYTGLQARASKSCNLQRDGCGQSIDLDLICTFTYKMSSSCTCDSLFVSKLIFQR